MRDKFAAVITPLRCKSRQMFDADELLNDEAKKDRQTWLKRVFTGK